MRVENITKETKQKKCVWNSHSHIRAKRPSRNDGSNICNVSKNGTSLRSRNVFSHLVVAIASRRRRRRAKKYWFIISFFLFISLVRTSQRLPACVFALPVYVSWAKAVKYILFFYSFFQFFPCLFFLFIFHFMFFSLARGIAYMRNANVQK